MDKKKKLQSKKQTGGEGEGARKVVGTNISAKATVAVAVGNKAAKKVPAAAAGKPVVVRAGMEFEDDGGLPGLGMVAASRPLAADGFASAREIAELIGDPGFDDAKLRALGNANNAAARNPETGVTWVPKPVGARWPLKETVAGVFAYVTQRAQGRTGLPEVFASMGDFVARTRFPLAMLEYALAHGCACRDAGNRISLTPFLDFFAPKFEKLFTVGGIKNLDDPDLKDLDLEQERAQNEREQRIARARDNALAEQRLHDRAAVEKSVQIEFLAPLREGLLALQKKKDRYGGSPEICVEIVCGDFPKFLAQLGDGRPELALAVAQAEPDVAADYSI